MPNDDPGWGGFTPLPDADTPPAAPVRAPSSTPRVASRQWLKNPKVRIAIVVIGVLVIVSGVKTMTGGTSHAEFIKAADQLCSDAIPAMRSAVQRNNIAEAAQLQQALTARVRALKQPNAAKGKLDQMYALLDADVQALTQGDLNSVRTIEAQFPSIGADIGFQVCMRNG